MKLKFSTGKPATSHMAHVGGLHYIRILEFQDSGLCLSLIHI